MNFIWPLPPLGGKDAKGRFGQVLFFPQELSDILNCLGDKLRATLAQVHLLEFFPVRRVQKVEMDEVLTLDRPKIFLEFPDHLLDLGISLLPVFFFFPPGRAVTEAQAHGSTHDGPANRSPTGYASSEGGGHLGRLRSIKIQILPEDRDHRLGSVQPARQEVE